MSPDRRINILYISSRADIGGGPAQMDSLVAGLDRPRFARYAAAPDEEPFFRRYREGCEAVLAIKKRAASPADLVALAKFIRRHSIDVVHSHGKGAGLYSRLLKFAFPRLKIVHSFHGFHFDAMSAPARAAYVALERGLSYLTDAFVCVSADEKAVYESYGIALADKTFLIENRVPASRLREIGEAAARGPMSAETAAIRFGRPIGPVGRTKNGASRAGVAAIVSDAAASAGPRPPAYFFTAARFDEVKRLPFLVAAFARASEGTNYKLMIAGLGEEFEKCRAIAAELGARERISFMGERADAALLIARCDYYLTASRREGMPLAPLEAMAAGVPVLASRVPGHEALIKEYEKGYLFEYDDEASFAAKLAEMVSAHPPAVPGARRVAEKWFDEAARNIRAYEELYSRVAGDENCRK